MTIPTAEADVFATVSQIQGLANVLPSKTQPTLLVSVKLKEDMIEKIEREDDAISDVGIVGNQFRLYRRAIDDKGTKSTCLRRSSMHGTGRLWKQMLLQSSERRLFF